MSNELRKQLPSFQLDIFEDLGIESPTADNLDAIMHRSSIINDLLSGIESAIRGHEPHHAFELIEEGKKDFPRLDNAWYRAMERAKEMETTT